MAHHVTPNSERCDIFRDVISGQEKTVCLEQHVKVRPPLQLANFVEDRASQAKKLKILHKRKLCFGDSLQIHVCRIEVDL